MRNCLLQVISPFLTMFSITVYLKCVKIWHCVVNGEVFKDEVISFQSILCQRNPLPKDIILDMTKLKLF